MFKKPATKTPASKANAAEIHIPDVNVREVRLGTGLSVAEFAARFGLTPSSVRSWEEGSSEPYSVARILLAIIATHPEVVDEVLHAPPKPPARFSKYPF
jgi:putative transcriptional regulator